MKYKQTNKLSNIFGTDWYLSLDFCSICHFYQILLILFFFSRLLINYVLLAALPFICVSCSFSMQVVVCVFVFINRKWKWAIESWSTYGFHRRLLLWPKLVGLLLLSLCVRMFGFGRHDKWLMINQNQNMLRKMRCGFFVFIYILCFADFFGFSVPEVACCLHSMEN